MRCGESTAQLVIESGNASDERHWARVRCEGIKMKIWELAEKTTKAKIIFLKLKDDTEEIRDSLTVECDECNDELLRFNAEYQH